MVHNFPERALAEPDDPDVAFEQRPFGFAYTGGLSEVQGVHAIVAVAEMLGSQVPGAIAGWFDDDRLEREVRAAPGWRSLWYLGQLPKPGVLATIREAEWS
ncbi:MAG: hypothetical protein LC721_12485 [Actinobacteria bacterium]|nr:hypothetical protein [Actinomycetota bacterium]